MISFFDLFHFVARLATGASVVVSCSFALAQGAPYPESLIIPDNFEAVPLEDDSFPPFQDDVSEGELAEDDAAEEKVEEEDAAPSPLPPEGTPIAPGLQDELLIPSPPTPTQDLASPELPTPELP
ncbi:MAG: hypothetical protein Q4D38_13850, partial [Planctomycetia bacterium]|nr:hypothetical protein [Planctomycetia bacterium]